MQESGPLSLGEKSFFFEKGIYNEGTMSSTGQGQHGRIAEEREILGGVNFLLGRTGVSLAYRATPVPVQ